MSLSNVMAVNTTALSSLTHPVCEQLLLKCPCGTSPVIICLDLLLVPLCLQ